MLLEQGIWVSPLIRYLLLPSRDIKSSKQPHPSWWWLGAGALKKRQSFKVYTTYYIRTSLWYNNGSNKMPRFYFYRIRASRFFPQSVMNTICHCHRLKIVEIKNLYRKWFKPFNQTDWLATWIIKIATSYKIAIYIRWQNPISLPDMF